METGAGNEGESREEGGELGDSRAPSAPDAGDKTSVAFAVQARAATTERSAGSV